ncbi:MAG TPA: hypothetical protein VJ728_02045 [Candidatus Binataceae bacterium]|nr:hypothetical protein [Candidatus Binataceae bacterium]
MIGRTQNVDVEVKGDRRDKGTAMSVIVPPGIIGTVLLTSLPDYMMARCPLFFYRQTCEELRKPGAAC